jgi:5-methylcytosine-specific restriction endonuclease McrA
VKHRVLTHARGCCECCGAGCCLANPAPAALEADPIVPKNHGGSDDLGNMQAFCFSCNAGKRWEARGGSASPSGWLGPLSTSEIQCLAVTSERTAMRS